MKTRWFSGGVQVRTGHTLHYINFISVSDSEPRGRLWSRHSVNTQTTPRLTDKLWNIAHSPKSAIAGDFPPEWHTNLTRCWITSQVFTEIFRLECSGRFRLIQTLIQFALGLEDNLLRIEIIIGESSGSSTFLKVTWWRFLRQETDPQNFSDPDPSYLSWHTCIFCTFFMSLVVRCLM